MTDEELNKRIKEYLKKNLEIDLSITDSEYSDSKEVRVSVFLDGEYIDESTDYVLL